MSSPCLFKMKPAWPVFLALIIVLVVPILLRPQAPRVEKTDIAVLTIITPHSEAIRSEFGRAFGAAHWEKTGQRVQIDWRSPGGTSEISRMISSSYLASFQYYWTAKLGRKWNRVVETSFDNPQVQIGEDPLRDGLAEQARREFLGSEVGCKMDLFFGGGAYDFQQQARVGRIVDAGFIGSHPELFGSGVGEIPPMLSGEPCWDEKGRWIGTAFSGFGICSNRDALARIGVDVAPARWSELGDARFFHELAIANPIQSGSINKAFEMLIQEQISEVMRKWQAKGDGEVARLDQSEGVYEGWKRAQQLLMRIGANARYFTDASTKIALDVESGEAAAGMVIDFYGRSQSEFVRKSDGSSRMNYVNAVDGTSIGVDPIAVFRGAPNPQLAKEFMAFVLSPAGQKLWNWKVGTPDGPKRYALRRLPILPSLYREEYRPLRSDPDVNPYSTATGFIYHPSWTGALFRSIAFTFRVMCIDPHEELTEAWRALIAADFPAEALAAFSDVSAVDYGMASGRMREVLAGDKVGEVELARELAEHFSKQYRRAGELARAGR